MEISFDKIKSDFAFWTVKFKTATPLVEAQTQQRTYGGKRTYSFNVEQKEAANTNHESKAPLSISIFAMNFIQLLI